MGVADEKLIDEILVLELHAGASSAATLLRAIGRKRRALHIARMGHRHDHVFLGDQVFVLDLAFGLNNLGSARRCEFIAYGGEVFLDDRHHPVAVAQDFEIILDLLRKTFQLIADFIAAERRQALQAQIENGLRLFLGQLELVAVAHHVTRIGDEQHQRRKVFCRPVLGHQLFFRRRRIGRGANERDDFVYIGDSDREADQNVSAIARLVEIELRAAGNYFLTEVDERAQNIPQRQLLGLSAVQGQHVDTETRLQLRVSIELVEHHIRSRIAAQFDHDANALTAGLVANIGNAFDLFLTHQTGDALDHQRFVHLKRNLGDDNAVSILAHLFDGRAAAHDHRTAPKQQTRFCAGAA